jgi:hypothetical protein
MFLTGRQRRRDKGCFDIFTSHPRGSTEEVMNRTQERTRALAALVDALLPGDEAFPSASQAGVHIKLEERAHRYIGDGFLDAILIKVSAAGTSNDALTSALAAMEKNAAGDFDLLLGVVYPAYYENLAVKEAIRGLGHAYNDQPQPSGHFLQPFDPSNKFEKPVHKRGSFVATDKVRRVDHASLGNLLNRVG